MTGEIGIIGAGLSGLLAAYKLKKAGHKIVVIEAQDRIGGRIHTVNGAADTPVEMGATWFGMQHRNLIQLLEELGLGYFEQYMDGRAYFEPFSTSPAQEIDIPQEVPNYRIAGGSHHLIKTLAADLVPEEILLNKPVNAIDFREDNIRVITPSAVIKVDKVISTLPPNLLVNTVHFRPKLPESLIEISLNTHTWMQNSIKVGLTYERPFWREKGLSGTLFSNVGPVNEFYDHTDAANSKFALCGFVNGGFASLGADERKTKVLDQLSRIFGGDAMNFLSFEETVWAKEEFTKYPHVHDLFPHQNNGHEIFQDSWYEGRLIVAGSETSRQFGGYMDGAVWSANQAVSSILN